jgi:NAD-dependent DNA ligase
MVVAADSFQELAVGDCDGETRRLKRLVLRQGKGERRMASKNVIGMMVEKGSPFSIEQLQEMDDRECWRWIYAHFPPKTKRSTSSKPAICFTGFRPDERADMEKLAQQNGYRVVGSVTLKLKVLVTGEAPGPAKLAKAQQQEVTILSAAEFLAQTSTSRSERPRPEEQG